MKPKLFISHKAALLAGVSFALILSFAAIRMSVKHVEPASHRPRATAQLPVPLASATISVETENAAPLRPLPVAQSSAHHEWTEGDGRDPQVIEKIAHNPDEFLRMAEEIERIHRRQLVYRNDTVAAVIQRAKASGEPIRTLILPGLDGQEIEVEVTHTDLAPSGQSGTFTGRLHGKPQSMVTLAFKFSREAFSVMSPEDGLYLEAEPREPGEIIVKSIDPELYAVGRCGTPDTSH